MVFHFICDPSFFPCYLYPIEASTAFMKVCFDRTIMNLSSANHFYHAALNAGQPSQEKAVCPSICLSNKWIVTKLKKNL